MRWFIPFLRSKSERHCATGVRTRLLRCRKSCTLATTHLHITTKITISTTIRRHRRSESLALLSQKEKKTMHEDVGKIDCYREFVFLLKLINLKIIECYNVFFIGKKSEEFVSRHIILFYLFFFFFVYYFLVCLVLYRAFGVGHRDECYWVSFLTECIFSRVFGAVCRRSKI